MKRFNRAAGSPQRNMALAAQVKKIVAHGCHARMPPCLMHDRLASHAAAGCRTASTNGVDCYSQSRHWPATQRAVNPPLHQSQPSITCHATRSAGTDSLAWVAPENRLDVLRVLEVAERAAERWELTCTDSFLTPPVAADVMSALAGRSDIRAMPWGGFSQAERCRLLMGREEVMDGVLAHPQGSGAVAAIQVKGNFMFDPAKHPDFLGAILGTGVVRERVGDILVQGETGAQILVHPDLVEHFESALTQVRTVPVKTERIDLSALQVAPPSVQELNTVEASLRLDALASAGFRMSRGKMTDMVKAGDVRVSWRPVTRAAMTLKAGDMVSVTGKGRLEIRSVTSRTTKKGDTKYAVTMVRYT